MSTPAGQETLFGLLSEELGEVEFTSWLKSSIYTRYVKIHIAPIFDQEFSEIKYYFEVDTIEELYKESMQAKLDDWMAENRLRHKIIAIPTPQ